MRLGSGLEPGSRTLSPVLFVKGGAAPSGGALMESSHRAGWVAHTRSNRLFAVLGSHLTPQASGKGEHSCFVASLPPSSGSSPCPSMPDAHEKVETKDGGVGATAHPPQPPTPPQTSSCREKVVGARGSCDSAPLWKPHPVEIKGPGVNRNKKY